MPRWHELGGFWLGEGLPHCAAIGRKPEIGCKLQAAACGQSGVTLSIEIAMVKEDCKGRLFEENRAHATVVNRRLASR